MDAKLSIIQVSETPVAFCPEDTDLEKLFDCYESGKTITASLSVTRFLNNHTLEARIYNITVGYDSSLTQWHAKSSESAPLPCPANLTRWLSRSMNKSQKMLLSICQNGNTSELDDALILGGNLGAKLDDKYLLETAVDKGYQLLISVIVNEKSRYLSPIIINRLACWICNKYDWPHVIEKLVKLGADLNYDATGKGETALRAAFFHNRECTIEVMFKSKLNPNVAENEAWYPPLTTAAYNGNYRYVEQLISHGAKVDIKGRMNATPLFISIIKSKQRVSLLLLDKGANPFIDCEYTDTVDKASIEYKDTPFALAIKNELTACVTKMLQSEHANVEQALKGLELAFENKKNDIALIIIKYLKEKSYDFCKPSLSGHTVISKCIQHNADLCIEFLDSDSESNYIWKPIKNKDTETTTAIKKAIECSSVKCLTILIKSPQFKAGTYSEDLNLAIQQQKAKVVFLLLEAGVQLTIKNNKSLKLAVESKSDDVLLVFIAYLNKNKLSKDFLQQRTTEKKTGYELLQSKAPNMLCLFTDFVLDTENEDYDIILPTESNGMELKERVTTM